MQASKLQQFQSPKRARGYNMIELMIGIAVVLVLLSAAFILLPRVMAGVRSKSTNQQIMSIVASVHEINPAPSYGAAGTDLAKLLVQSKKAPADMTTAGAFTLTNQWGGTVTVASSTYNGGAAGNAFTITVPSVPTSECNTILAAQKDTFVSVGTDTTPIVKDQATGVVPTTASIVAACIKTSNQLTFVGN